MSGLDTREEPDTISSLKRLFWPHLRPKKNWSGARLESGKPIGLLLLSPREERTIAWTKALSEGWRDK